jgi:pyruvate dehydrogenase E1 component alpha subunit
VQQQASGVLGELREVSATTSAAPPAAVLYERMCLIRRVEERVIEEYASRRIRMAVHLSNGQEAVAVGVLAAATPHDTTVGTHRSHAVYLAKGGDLQAFVDELYSLPTGCSGGFGGSMHLSAPDVGMLGATAVLTGAVPVVVGTAFAHQRAADGTIAYAFTGDGGIDEGAFWESLNLAALLRLPVLFVVENNRYSTLTHQARRQANPDVVRKAEAFGVPSRRIDGNDVVQVANAAVEATEAMRQGGGPRLLEALTFRFVAHVGVESDWGSGRPLDELAAWPGCDPLARLRATELLGEGEVAAMEASVAERVDAAFHTAIGRFEDLNASMQLAAPPPPDPGRV